MVWWFTETYMASTNFEIAISRKSCLSAAWYSKAAARGHVLRHSYHLCPDLIILAFLILQVFAFGGLPESKYR